MGIVIRNKKKFWKWSQTIEQRLCPNEQYLGNLLYRKPEIIPMQNIRKSKIQVMLWGATIDNLEIDLIGLSKTGEISIIETKLSTNKEIDPSRPNNIFQQVDKYVNLLMNKDYNSLNKKVQNTEGKSLLELLKDKKKTLSNKDLTKFKKNIEKNLRLGNFLLLFVTDNIGQNSSFVDEILRRRKKEKNIYALELSCFMDENKEIIVPRLFPVLLSRKQIESHKRSNAEDTFWEKVPLYCNLENSKKIRRIYNWIKKKKIFEIKWYSPPTFIDALSFGPFIKRNKQNLFYLDCYGILRICKRSSYLREFQKILTKEIKVVYDGWYYFPINRLRNDQKMKEFKKLIEKAERAK